MRDNNQTQKHQTRPPRSALVRRTREPGVWLNPYAVIYARATVEPASYLELMAKHATVYVSPDAQLPIPEEPAPGFIVRYAITRIGGIGPWATALRAELASR